MLRIANILCPTDFSPSAQAAISVACSLARDYGAALTLLYVREPVPAVMGEFGSIPPPPREPDDALIAKMRAHVPADSQGAIAFEILDGNAAEKILACARERSCDLVVIGTHGRTGLNRLLVGSVADAVLRGASCPVLTIRPKAPAEAKSEDAEEPEPTLDANDLATVCSVATPMEAEIIRNALKQEGIASFIEGSQQAGMVGLLGIPIRIQVRVGDFDRAKKFIEKREAHRPVQV